MGGRGRRIGGGVSEYNPAAIRSFGGGGGTGGTLGEALRNTVGLGEFGRNASGADPRELVNVGNRDIRIANPTRGRRIGGGGGGAGTTTTTTATTGTTGTVKPPKRAKTAKIAGNSKFTKGLEKEFGIGRKGRDSVTAANWNGNFEAKMTGVGAKAKVQALFGKEYSARDLGLMVGAPDGSKVTIKNTKRGELEIKVAHPYFTALTRTVSKDSRGDLKIHNDIFLKNTYNSNAPEGLGGRQLSLQAAVARKMGVKYIDTSAASGGGYNGYYTWARAGFNAKLSSANWKGGTPPLPRHLSKVTDLNGLMRFDAKQRRLGHKTDSAGNFTSGLYKGQQSGADYWRTHGTWSTMKFDLDKTSTSSKVLAYWQKEKGVTSSRFDYKRGKKTRRVSKADTKTRRTRT